MEQPELESLSCYFRFGLNVVNILLGELPLSKNNKNIKLTSYSKQYFVFKKGANC